MNYRNLYSRLRIQSTATQNEIKTAYYSLSKLFHPDLNRDDKSAVTNFRHITEAYQVLGSPSSRAAYDKANLPKRKQSRFGIFKKPHRYESAYQSEVEDINNTLLEKRMRDYKTKFVNRNN